MHPEPLDAKLQHSEHRLLEQRLKEAEIEICQIRSELRHSKNLSSLQRAVLLLALCSALLIPQRVPKWAENALAILASGGAVLLLGGDRGILTKILTQKLF